MNEEDDQPETSRAGAKRMKRLLAAQRLCKPSIAAVHHPSSTLIYPNGPLNHLHTSLSSHRSPRPLQTPQLLTAGREVSISPCGRWTTIFHPNPPLPNQVVEGGTLAIYSSEALLSPIQKNQGGTAPLASFPLNSDVLGIQYLYPPRQYIPGKDGRAKPRGPLTPKGYTTENGPALIVLLPTSLILLHPQQAIPSQPGAGKGYVIGMLTCPLHTRWHASPGGSMPPETGWKVDRGWIGLVGGDEGVWVGWERKGERGVVRAEVGVKGGVPWMRTTPMPALPSSSLSATGQGSDEPRSTFCQGIIFHELPSTVGLTDSSNRDEAKSNNQEGQRRMVAITIIQHHLYTDATGGQTPQTSLETYGFEQRQVELVDGFNEISGSTQDTDTIPKSWDWFALPSALSNIVSPPYTLILSLSPLPHVPPSTLALAVISTASSSLELIHLDLCPSDKQWRTIGEGVELDIPLMGEIQLVPSQSVQRGLRGLVAVISRETGSKLVVMPPILPRPDRHQAKMEDNGEGGVQLDIANGSEGMDTWARDAAEGILLAVKQGVGYDDIVRAVYAITPKDQYKGLAHDILIKAFELFEDDLQTDENLEIHRLQVALFRHIANERLSIAAELVKIHEASHLFDSCAIPNADGTGEITFHVDTVWSLLFVAEWVIGSLGRTFRSITMYKGNLAWASSSSTSSSPHSPSPDSPPISFLHIFHPTLRTLLIRLLSQINTFRNFVQKLEEPILQPESRSPAKGPKRDTRATILARERARGLGEGEGVDMAVWGGVLEGIEDPPTSAETTSTLNNAYLSLDPSPLLSLHSVIPLILSLPSPSALFLSDPEHPEEMFDAITFEPIVPADPRGIVGCDKCHWATVALGREAHLGGTVDEKGIRGWRGWRKEREGGCGCGGSWSIGQ